jgi:hypothetical protein
MIRPASLSLLLLLGALGLPSSAGAQSPAAAAVGDAPAQSAPAPAKKAKAKKPAAPKKEKADGLSLPNAVAGDAGKRGYSETLPMPRRIDPDDIADPYGGVGGGRGSRVAPMMSPSGRPGIGGRF